MTDATLYKVLSPTGDCLNGGVGAWSLPKGSRPGRWMPAVKDPVLCRRGYHVVQLPHLLTEWMGPAIFTVEVRGQTRTGHDKVVAEQARLLARTPWDDRVARLFAVDCMERLLPWFEASHPTNQAPRQMLAAARSYASGDTNALQMLASLDITPEGTQFFEPGNFWKTAKEIAAFARTNVPRPSEATRQFLALLYRIVGGEVPPDAAEDERTWQQQRLAAYLSGEAS